MLCYIPQTLFNVTIMKVLNLLISFIERQLKLFQRLSYHTNRTNEVSKTLVSLRDVCEFFYSVCFFKK